RAARGTPVARIGLQGPAAAAALPGRATVAVVRNADRSPDSVGYQEVAQLRPWSGSERSGHAQHLVEVAVVEVSLPVHAQERSAHHRREVFASVGVLEQAHVPVETALAQEGAAKTLHGHVRDGKQLVEIGSASGRERE